MFNIGIRYLTKYLHWMIICWYNFLVHKQCNSKIRPYFVAMHFVGEGPLSNPCLTWVLLPFLYCRGKSSLLSRRKFPVLSTPLPSLLFLRRHVVRTVMQSHLICSRSTTVYSTRIWKPNGISAVGIWCITFVSTFENSTTEITNLRTYA